MAAVYWRQQMDLAATNGAYGSQKSHRTYEGTKRKASTERQREPKSLVVLVGVQLKRFKLYPYQAYQEFSAFDIPPSASRHPPPTICNYLPSTICHQPSIVSHQQLAICNG
jgi:hypothetical protein